MDVAGIKRKWARGEAAFGLFLQYVTNPTVVTVFPEGTWDFAILNTEHSALDMGAWHGMQFALRSRGIACLMRIHTRNAEDVSKACDAFPDGVVVPYVEDVEEAKVLVAAAKFRPLKQAALDRVIATGQWPSAKTREYALSKCAKTLAVLMIESVRAMENLEAICAIPGLDAVFVGPNDLSVSMGIPDEFDHPDFVKAVQRVIDVARKHGIAGGAHFSTLDHALRTIRQGGQFVPYAEDKSYIKWGAEAAFADLSRTYEQSLKKRGVARQSGRVKRAAKPKVSGLNSGHA